MQKIVALRKILMENNLKDGDQILLQAIKKFSETFYINCKKQIDVENTKTCSMMDVKKNSANVNMI
jgi:hypothetical protein